MNSSSPNNKQKHATYACNWLIVSAFFCLTSVIIGAFAAHSLKALLSPEDLSIIETAARYQMYHGLTIALVSVISLALSNLPDALNVDKKLSKMLATNSFFTLGILCFSGSLYCIAISRLESLSVELPQFVFFITPLGGLLFILGWLAFGYTAFNLRNTFKKMTTL